MRHSVLLALALLASAPTAAAQPSFFADGDLFADLKRFSANDTSNTLNGNAFGGGVEGGVFFTPQWSLALGVHIGGTTSTSTPIPIGVLARNINVTPPISSYSTEVTNRIVATSMLVGYHFGLHDRMHIGAVGGLSFLHVRRVFNTMYPVPGPLAAIPDALVIRPYSLVDNVPAATVGGELAVDLSTHLALVSALRAHAFTLSNGGPSGFAIRPGVGARWMF